MNNEDIIQDLKFVVIRDIIETQLEFMKQENFRHDGIKTSFKDLSPKVIENGMQALNLLAFDNGRKVTTKNGTEISLCSFIKNLISKEGKYRAVEQMEKLLTSDRLTDEVKADLRIYLNIRFIDEDAISLISDLSDEHLSDPILLRQLQGYNRSDITYLNTLKNLSNYSLGNDIYKSFPESIRNSLSKNLMFCFAVNTDKLKGSEIEKEEVSSENLQSKVKIQADDSFWRKL